LNLDTTGDPHSIDQKTKTPIQVFSAFAIRNEYMACRTAALSEPTIERRVHRNAMVRRPMAAQMPS
jgi:hypothetical protein